MGKFSVVLSGAIGVLVGILLAPRKGSETRDQIIQRSKPLQQAAKNAVSRAGDAAACPLPRWLVKEFPCSVRAREDVEPEEPTGENGDKSSPTGEGREDGKDGRPESQYREGQQSQLNSCSTGTGILNSRILSPLERDLAVRRNPFEPSLSCRTLPLA